MKPGHDRPIFVALLHSPMVDRNGKEVCTAVTNLDIHDIARTCKTYGVTKYFIVNPEEEQERLVKVILDHWKNEVAKVHHPARATALEVVQFVRTFEEAFNEASFLSNSSPSGGIDRTRSCSIDSQPFVVMPDAKDLPESWSYPELRERLETSGLPGDGPGLRPLMIVFGTGWGISPSFYNKVDRALKPIWGLGKRYNHLSVRAAAAVVLDRVFGI